VRFGTKPEIEILCFWLSGRSAARALVVIDKARVMFDFCFCSTVAKIFAFLLQKTAIEEVQGGKFFIPNR